MSLTKLYSLLDGCVDSCTVKKVSHFPVPRRDVTDQTLSGREKFNYSCPRRVWSVTSWLGTGKRLSLIYSVYSLTDVSYTDVTVSFSDSLLFG